MVLFLERVSTWELEKPTALSETIIWGRSLEWLWATEITEQIVYSSLSDLAKSREDADRLRTATKYLPNYMQSHRAEEVAEDTSITEPATPNPNKYNALNDENAEESTWLI